MRDIEVTTRKENNVKAINIQRNIRNDGHKQHVLCMVTDHADQLAHALVFLVEKEQLVVDDLLSHPLGSGLGNEIPQESIPLPIVEGDGGSDNRAHAHQQQT